jgi:hypothetical protein
MPETLLMLDLMVQETCVDLRQMSDLVLADVGATLQILRLAGREYGTEAGRPTRIADCIADLGLRACLKAVSGQTIGRQERRGEIVAFWEHSRAIAEHSELVAQGIVDVDAGEAYLAGLFHGIGYLPEILGWNEQGVADPVVTGLRLARLWSLPACVTELCTELYQPGSGGRWAGIVHDAHLRGTRSATGCLFEQELRPYLHLDRDGTC